MSFKVGDRVQIIKSEWNKEARGKKGTIHTIRGERLQGFTAYLVRLDEPLESLKNRTPVEGEPNYVPDEVYCLSQELSLEK